MNFYTNTENIIQAARDNQLEMDILLDTINQISIVLSEDPEVKGYYMRKNPTVKKLLDQQYKIRELIKEYQGERDERLRNISYYS